jgi:hypothetical protein
MKIFKTRNTVTIRFDETFDFRDAINLPKVIRQFEAVGAVTLDFRDVRWVRESVLATLIPALASMRRPPIRVIGLEDAAPELAGLVAAIA